MEESDRIAEELQSVVPGRVVSDVKAYLRDWWPIFLVSPKEEGTALVGVKPQNVEEVARVVKYAASSKLRVLCRGGGSSVTGASVPHGGIVVDMTGMNQVLDLDENNRTVTVQAGIRLSELEPKLNKKSFTLGQFPQSYELVTVGGYISTMGTGQYSSKYGGIEDSVIRLQVVLPGGDVVWTRNRSTPRSSVGPDLSRLFIGAEGVFGIVSAAELKLHKLPNHTWKAAYIFEDFATAVISGRVLMDLDVKPAVCRVYDEVEASFQFGTPKPVMLLVYSFASASVMEATTREVMESVGSCGKAGEPTLVDVWLEKRFAFREQMDSIQNMGYMLDTVEMGCKWSRVFDNYSDVVTTLSAIDGVSVVGAHVSHLYEQGACTYFTMIFKPDAGLYWDIWNALAQIAERHDATLSHHHGVGVLKAGLVRKEVPHGLVRLLRSAVDPNGTMNSSRSS